jgi:hypothetical protein
MTKPTMTSQWDPGNYKPLDMNNILGYPQQMPFEYINFLPGFSGGDRERADYHMRNFWSFFLSYPIDDYAEDVVMKLFLTTLWCNAKGWYDNLPDAGITTMEQFEKTFLERWGIQLEDIPALLKELEHIKQAEDITLRYNLHLAFLVIITLCNTLMSQSGDITTLLWMQLFPSPFIAIYS